MIILIWLVNFMISWGNAWGCGKTWTESRHAGGMPHFINWAAAIMSASGFTWCYLVILGGLGSVIPYETADDGSTTMLLSGAAAQAFADLGYITIILPIIGSGLALTVHSWGKFWRERNFINGVEAGWNTYAQVYNMAGAFEHAPRAASGVGNFFSSDDDDDVTDRIKLLVLLLVIGVAIGGCLTTRWILLSTARGTAFARRLRYETA